MEDHFQIHASLGMIFVCILNLVGGGGKNLRLNPVNEFLFLVHGH